jgi:Xaa-Pro dipeptidase
MLMNAPRLQDRMRKDGLSAVVATSPENVTYSSGFWCMSQWIRRGPQAYVVIPADNVGAPCVIASSQVIDLIADQDVWVRDIRRYGLFVVDHTPNVELDSCDRQIDGMLQAPDQGDAIAALVKSLKEYGLEGKKVGVDELGILPGLWDKLLAAMPTTTFVRCENVFRHARAIKTPDEVARLRKSAQIAEQSIVAAMAVARPGATEMDLARAFHNCTINEGGMPVLGCIGFGLRSAMANVQPSERKLQNGEIIRFDVGGRYRHYRADIARNGFLGEPSAKVKKFHRAIRVGLEVCHELIKPGMRTAEVFDKAVAAVQREGIPHYQRHHVGHGIGLDGYDAPDIAPSSKEVFEEGMVICAETPYYEMGFGGLQVEDTMVVTRDGVDSFMKTSAELRVV